MRLPVRLPVRLAVRSEPVCSLPVRVSWHVHRTRPPKRPARPGRRSGPEDTAALAAGCSQQALAPSLGAVARQRRVRLAGHRFRASAAPST